MKKKKKRLDEILIEKGFAKDTHAAFVLVTGGRVLVDGHRAVSPAEIITQRARIDMPQENGYVGRAAHKLAAALDAFAVDPAGKICADIGAATGGFSEVLLRRGAAQVYAIDTARGKLAYKIRQEPRVVVMEQTDVRDLKNLPDQIALAVIDVSLVPLASILGAVRRLIRPDAAVVALFKPQYETRDAAVLRHGVIRDPAEREKLLADFGEWARTHDWVIQGQVESPIRGNKGNAEYLFFLTNR